MWIKSLEMYNNVLLFRHVQDTVTRFRTQKSVPYTDLDGSSPIMLEADRSVFSSANALTHINSSVRVAGVERRNGRYLPQERLVLAMYGYEL